jgi:hypothetical protein
VVLFPRSYLCFEAKRALHFYNRVQFVSPAEGMMAVAVAEDESELSPLTVLYDLGWHLRVISAKPSKQFQDLQSLLSKLADSGRDGHRNHWAKRRRQVSGGNQVGEARAVCGSRAVQISGEFCASAREFALRAVSMLSELAAENQSHLGVVKPFQSRWRLIRIIEPSE